MTIGHCSHRWHYVDNDEAVDHVYWECGTCHKKVDIDGLVRAETAFKSLEAMADTAPTYRPSLDIREVATLAIADAYDEMMRARGDDRRAWRWPTKLTAARKL